MNGNTDTDKQVRITLLGTGTPVLDPARQHSSILIEIGEEKLLFDCGRGVTLQLTRMNIPSKQVNTVFITHHHYDHICDLGEFLMTSWHNGHHQPFFIYGPNGTANIVAALLEQVYARDINFALFTEDDVVDLRELVQVREIVPGLVYDSGKWKIYAEFVNHGNSLGLSQEDWACFGYRIEADGKVIAISGDTVACEGLNRLAREADCLIQCCYLADAELTNSAFKRSAKHIIASSGQVGKIAVDNNVKKLVLTHIRPKSEAMMCSLLDDVRNIYDGEVILGTDLMVIEV